MVSTATSPPEWDLEGEEIDEDVDLSDLDLALRHEMERMLARRLQLTTPTATVTLKFTLNTGECLTTAHDHISEFSAIKQELAAKFNVPYKVLAIFKDDKEVLDTDCPANLGVAPFSSLDLRLESKDHHWQLRNTHLMLPTPDIITVNVENRSVVVEIENRAIRKPYMGGYRNAQTGIDYLHASTQTGPPPSRIPNDKKCTRDTQTVANTSKCTATSSDTFTQSGDSPYIYQKIIRPGIYKEAKVGDREKAARLIQRNLRAAAFRRKVKELSAEYKRLAAAEENETARQEKQIEQKRHEEIKRMACPKTRRDFDALYIMVDRWREAQTKRIADLKTEAPKKAELCTILEKEVKLLESIEAHRIRVRDEIEQSKAKMILKEAGKPIAWTGYKGVQVSMDTLRTQRARELAKLYEALGEDTPASVRVERLLALKHALTAVNTDTTDELTELVDREAELLTRGAKTTQMDFLRARIQHLFVKFFQETGIAKEKENKCHTMCKQCRKLRSSRQFELSSRKPELNICIFCKTSYGDSRAAQDFRHILKSVRTDEMRKNCFSSCAFIMNEEDMAYLAGNLWHGKSIMSGVDNLDVLRFVRWDKDQDWTPWNCILLTAQEARWHERAGYKSYTDKVKKDIFIKHEMAKAQFRMLRAADARIRDSGAWVNVSCKIQDMKDK